ncbi:bacitracin ABC transporter ATP-binding protein [Peribacillus simplex]|nr:bacitracin ABC transporter ATP-binding protein [Peribacillus simplex]WHY58607.1 bacitracin ABC transporter ATP-binding protein [Peribacillus simplex]
MFKDNSPFLSDEFLDELAKDINQQYEGPTKEQIAEPINND